MSRQLVIYFIYAKECKDCDHMRSVLAEAIENSLYGKEHCSIKEINSDLEEAIEISLDNNIDDLPACVIGNLSFCGKDGYNYDSILEAIEKTLEE